MKRKSNLYKDVCDIENIIEMTNLVLSKVKNKDRRENFIKHKMEHIINIKNILDGKNINFGKYNIFLISDPKYRIIMSLNIDYKIINHLICKYILINTF